MSQQGPTFPRLLTAPEVAEVLRATLRQAYNLMANGEIPAVRIGQTNVRVDADDLAAYIASRREAVGVR